MSKYILLLYFCFLLKVCAILDPVLIGSFQESKLGHVRAQLQVSIVSFCILCVPVLAKAGDLVIVSLLFDTSSCSLSEKECSLLLAL